MALESQTRAATISRDRETSSADSHPALGTRAVVALGQALDQSPDWRSRAGKAHTPLTRLRAMRELRETLELLERVEVAAAIRGGASYEDVGRSLGLSRSAAHRKHGGKR